MHLPYCSQSTHKSYNKDSTYYSEAQFSTETELQISLMKQPEDEIKEQKFPNVTVE